MGAVDDTRKVLKYFTAPELRATSVRLDALAKRHESLAEDMGRRFDHTDKQAEPHYDALQLSIQSLLNSNELRERMERLHSAKESVGH